MSKPIAPRQIQRIGGFVGQRFSRNHTNRLCNESMVEQFIAQHEQKDHTDWFWLGEQIGKWLDAASYSALIAKDAALEQHVHTIIDRLAQSQEADGYIGITPRWQRNPVRGMQLYEWYYVLHGLLVAHELLDSQKALDIATRLGRYIIATWGPEPGQFPLMGRYPGNGHDGGEGTLILEPIVLLGMRTGDSQFVDWGESTLEMWDTWADQYPESTHTGSFSAMRAAAEGKAKIHDIRPNVHAHTLHMTLLGIAALHDATGNALYRDVVLGCIEAIRKEYIFITGGMSSGERYVPFPYYNPRNDIEVCPQHTWILLCEKAQQWTGQPVYAEEIERTLLNNFLAAQLADGSNWSYMAPMNSPAQAPESPNCCNAAGHRIAARMPTFLFSEEDGGVALHQYAESDIKFRSVEGVEIRLSQRTEYPSDGVVQITVDMDQPTRFPLRLRIPSFAQGAALTINGKERIEADAGTYALVEREWHPQDKLELSMPLSVRLHAGSEQAAVLRGPLVYAYFQTWQDDPQRFYWSQGVYPGDVELLLDPDETSDLTDQIREEEPPEGCIGPALRVKARQKPRAPMFVHPEANAQLPKETTDEVKLLPFVNQGVRPGHHGVFLSCRAR